MEPVHQEFKFEGWLNPEFLQNENHTEPPVSLAPLTFDETNRRSTPIFQVPVSELKHMHITSDDYSRLGVFRIGGPQLASSHNASAQKSIVLNALYPKKSQKQSAPLEWTQDTLSFQVHDNRRDIQHAPQRPMRLMSTDPQPRRLLPKHGDLIQKSQSPPIKKQRMLENIPGAYIGVDYSSRKPMNRVERASNKRACLNCKRKKMACSGGFPCKSCTKIPHDKHISIWCFIPDLLELNFIEQVFRLKWSEYFNVETLSNTFSTSAQDKTTWKYRYIQHFFRKIGLRGIDQSRQICTKIVLFSELQHWPFFGNLWAWIVSDILYPEIHMDKSLSARTQGERLMGITVESIRSSLKLIQAYIRKALEMQLDNRREVQMMQNLVRFLQSVDGWKRQCPLNPSMADMSEHMESYLNYCLMCLGYKNFHLEGRDTLASQGQGVVHIVIEAGIISEDLVRATQ